MTKKQRLLEWLGRVESRTLLESQVVASGMSAALNDLLLEGKVTLIAHPTVKERGGAPAAAVCLVDSTAAR
jgi:hypothetical protein